MSANDTLLPLLSASARGDQKAFRLLYEKTSAHLFGVCVRILRRQEWAEEAMQEAFVKIWHHAGDYHPDKGTVMTWLISIVRYRALDMLRRHQDTEELDDDLLESIPDLSPGPLEMKLYHADLVALNKCIETLQDNQKQSISLAFLHGLTHEQLTTQLNVPLGTVKSWVRRGLQALKRCLET